MINPIDQNILDITEGIICHQVNTQGVMGAGIALKIKEKFPLAYRHYRSICTSQSKLSPLGRCLISSIYSLKIAHIFGQDKFGRDKQYTDYKAVQNAFQELAIWNKVEDHAIFIPENMGCSNAGGDWKIYLDIIKETLDGFDVFICSYPK